MHVLPTPKWPGTTAAKYIELQWKRMNGRGDFFNNKFVSNITVVYYADEHRLYICNDLLFDSEEIDWTDYNREHRNDVDRAYV
jgi:hypothetical protein